MDINIRLTIERVIWKGSRLDGNRKSSWVSRCCSIPQPRKGSKQRLLEGIKQDVLEMIRGTDAEPFFIEDCTQCIYLQQLSDQPLPRGRALFGGQSIL